MNLRTLNDIFFAVVGADRPSIVMERAAEQWVSLSSAEYYRRVAGMARGLRGLGIGKGDRVGIFSENRVEWTVADFAVLALGAVVVPVYATLTGDQVAYILRDSGVRVLFVSSERLLKKVLEILSQTTVEKIVVMDAVAQSERVCSMHRFMSDGPAGRDSEFEAGARAILPEDLATIIYTSGTTGTPKGVMLTHGNMASNICCSLSEFGVQAGAVSISFLPLSHVTARHVDFAMLYHGVTLAYVSSPDRLASALLEVRPNIFVAVPRMYEKIHAQVDLKTRGFPKRWIYRWALAIGKRHRSETLVGRTPSSLAWKIANRVVYSQVRAGLGASVDLFISGGAPLGRELAEWYADIGIRIHEGYGLTETSPVIAVNTPKAHRLGTVGRPLANVEVRIAEDGEVLVRGPSVFAAYWNQPEETEKAFVDGWFKTGDIGNLDGDGFLSITDRKKDLIKTSGGKFIAPQPIENSLKHNALIAEAVVIGDQRKFPAVLIAPSFAVLEDWARERNLIFSSRQELVRSKEVCALYEGMVADLNQNLARFEKLKRVLLVPDEFSSDNGTLTASMKLKRRVVAERYRREIDAMYADAEEAVIEARQDSQ